MSAISVQMQTVQAGASPRAKPVGTIPAIAPGAQQQPGDQDLLKRLRQGDEAAFLTMVERHHTAMLRVALTYVHDRAAAEEVVQDTWMGLLQGLERFEGRSSVKTWLFHILINKAKTRAQRDTRMITFSSLASHGGEDDEPAVDPESFLPADHPQWPGHWALSPRSWDALPEERIISHETQERVRQAIAELPEAQRRVITLRDVEGWATEEICSLLNISESNQRVLLHRARSKVRQALEAYFGDA